jgi:hypothetical protein
MPETPCGPRSEGGQGGQRKPGPQSGPVLAQPAPGWCRPLLRTHATKCFVGETGILILATKRTADGLWGHSQTTPVPLRDCCRCRDCYRCAARPLLISGGEPS